MNYIIQHAPNITGIVLEVRENCILIESDSGLYSVSRSTQNKDSMGYFNVGDEVVVYYDGIALESYPAQINTVYAITLKDPSVRNENNMP